MLHRLPRASVLSLIAGVLVLAACDDDDPVSPPPNNPITETSTATLVSLNGSSATGTATFSLTDDTLIARVDVAGADTLLAHRQYVMLGTACPAAAADTNADGFIDILEGEASFGQILIPLDGDISTQAGGSATFPTADASGAYTFADTVSFTDLMADLTATDPDHNDAIVKLSSANLDLENRTVVVLGVSDTTTLPATVLGRGTLTAQQSLPVACGTID